VDRAVNEFGPRPYTDADLPVLQETVAGWIAVAGRCGYDHIGELPHRIYENLRGRRPVGELVQVWEDRGSIMGVEINLRFGCAFDVFVAPTLRGTAAEMTMLRHAAHTTGRYASPAEEFVLTDLFDCDTMRAQLLTELGFERFRTWDNVTERALDDTLPPVGSPTGFTVRSARPSDAEQLAEAHNDAFGDDWTGPQYLAEVMSKPGYDPSREIVVEAADGRIAAFCVYWTDSLNKVGHFEPVGTRPDFQRHGLARAAMAHAMARMQDARLTLVTVNYNAENLAAQKLYASLGFVHVEQTSGYRRPIAR
jgi:mycothiol synthase